MEERLPERKRNVLPLNGCDPCGHKSNYPNATCIPKSQDKTNFDRHGKAFKDRTANALAPDLHRPYHLLLTAGKTPCASGPVTATS